MSSNQFCERHEDDNTGTSQELTVTAIPKARLEVRIKMESPKGGSRAKYTLHRYRVRALVHMLQEWLEATKDQDVAGESVETESVEDMSPIPFDEEDRRLAGID